MAEEKIEKMTTGQLKQKDKTATGFLIGSLIVFLVCYTALMILKTDLAGIAIPILAPAVIAMREKKRIMNTLIARVEKQEKEIKELKGLA